MNREIKFRAWDMEHKVMTPVADISFGDDGSSLTVIFETAPKQKFYRGLVDNESGVLMQFTGLKDKNGKEIYEGDICTSTYSVTASEIKFGEYHDAADDEDECTNIGFYWGEHDYLIPFGRGVNGGLSHIEVIGNIYENPELLK